MPIRVSSSSAGRREEAAGAISGFGADLGQQPAGRPAAMKTPSVTGSEARPASTGVYPSTAWK